MVISPERKQSIDALVEGLQCYKTPSGFDYGSLAQRHTIAFVETSRVASSLAVRHNGQDYIFGAHHFVTALRDYELAHEFGHVLLWHTDHANSKTKRQTEAEADYFATKLTGMPHWKYRLIRIPEIVCQLLFNADPGFRYLIRSHLVEDVASLITEWNEQHSRKAVSANQ